MFVLFNIIQRYNTNANGTDMNLYNIYAGLYKKFTGKINGYNV